MMKQYFKIKQDYEDCILFYRVGDFYEMFFDDAKKASEELDLVLTGKECGLSERAPMCGVPFHSCDNYIARLVAKGYKVAICEQTEDPSKAKKLVKREVVHIVTPGTVIEDSMLDESRNNYLAALSLKNGTVGLCFTDASTGESHLTEISGDSVVRRTADELSRFSPSEVLCDSSVKADPGMSKLLYEDFSGTVTERSREDFDTSVTEPLLLEHFSVVSTENLGITSGSAAESALGAAIRYLYETGVSGSISVNQVDFYTDSQYMRLEMTAVRNLELCETMRSKSKKGSLLWVLDRTKTAMGKRLIRSWVEHPLLSINEIMLRQNAVEELCSGTVLRGELINGMSGVRDIERLMTRVVYGSASARDLLSLADTAARFYPIKMLLQNVNSRMLKTIFGDIDPLEEIVELIKNAISEQPPATVREGGLIKDGYSEQVDLLRSDMNNGTGYLTDIETRERERTGIKNLRVRYNKVFGYYIEVTNSALDKVPEDYIRKQTLTNCERFITDELKELEMRVLSAKDRVVQLEYELFDGVRRKAAAEIIRFQKTAAAIARLDSLCSLAEVAANNDYCRPLVDNSGVIHIKDGRHPVVEQMIKTPFVSNDTMLDGGENRCAIITGPNMAGKSTYMRQVALITLMAQIGSFVPAKIAQIGIADAIYTRVGASDDLASGQSTFMVEMSEVADILKNATKNSLLILDEIGRGTSTYDGMSIARAVLEFVAEKRKLGARALFATHYHELTEMENELQGVKNFNIAVKKRGDDIIFLRRIVPGGADDSYGIEVAKLSGIPESVIKRAKDILKQTIEDGVITYRTAAAPQAQLPIELQGASELLKELQMLDVNTLTPIEAMGILFDLATKAKSI